MKWQNYMYGPLGLSLELITTRKKTLEQMNESKQSSSGKLNSECAVDNLTRQQTNQQPHVMRLSCFLAVLFFGSLFCSVFGS